MYACTIAVLPGRAPGSGIRNATLSDGDTGRLGPAVTGRIKVTISDLGEFGLIASFAARLPRAAGTLVGIGDDAAVLAMPDGRVVASTDLLIEGRHFRRDWSGPAEIGGKAAAQNLADVAAMGADPTALLVGLALPATESADWAQRLVSGIASECAAAGATVVGGDLAGADTVMIAVTALGNLA